MVSQSAEKIYKSINNTKAVINNEIIVGENSWLGSYPRNNFI